MDTLKQCETVFELVSILPSLFPHATVKNYSASGRIEIHSQAARIVVYYDADKIVYINEELSQVA